MRRSALLARVGSRGASGPRGVDPRSEIAGAVAATAAQIHLGTCRAPRRTLDAPAAILLLSGGLDSYTAGAIARAEGYRLFALTVRYGQTHVQEMEAARRAADALGVERHVELDLDLRDIAKSALTGASEVPLDR